MREKYFNIIAAVSCVAVLMGSASVASAQVFNFNFVGQPGNQEFTNPTAQPANGTVSSFRRALISTTVNRVTTVAGTTPAPRGGAGSINSENWIDAGDTGTLAEAIAQQEYYTFTAAPNAGGTMNINSFTFAHRKLGSGPDFYSLQYVRNGITTVVNFDQPTNPQGLTPTVSFGTGLQNVTSPVEFRLIGYNVNANNTNGGNQGTDGGGWILENVLSAQGSFVAPIVIPEAGSASLVLLSLGSAGLCGVVRRRNAAK